jgi:hypothetical protein
LDPRAKHLQPALHAVPLASNQVIRCRSFGKDGVGEGVKRYLAEDMSVDCRSEYYHSACFTFGLACTFFYTAGIPLMLLYILATRISPSAKKMRRSLGGKNPMVLIHIEYLERSWHQVPAAITSHRRPLTARRAKRPSLLAQLIRYGFDGSALIFLRKNMSQTTGIGKLSR